MARRPIEPQIKQGLEKKFKAEGTKREAVLNQLLKIIMRGEVPKTLDKNPYDTIVGYNIVKLNKPLTKMTIGEIRANGREIVNKTKGKLNDPNGGGSSAVGAFQILSNEFKKDQKDGIKKVIPYSSNLGRLQKLAGLSDDTLFTPEVQKTLAKELILNIADKELTEYVREPSQKNASALISRIGRNGNPRNKNTDGWASITDLEYVGRSTTKTPKLNYGKGYIEKLVETYDEEPLDNKTTDDQMSNLGLSSNQSETQSNPNKDRKNQNTTIDQIVNRFRNVLKEKETIKTLKQIETAQDVLSTAGPGTSLSGVVDKLLKSKNIEKDVNNLDDKSTFDIFKYMRDAVNEILGIKEAGASEKFNIDQIKTLQQKFNDMISRTGPGFDTSDTGVKRTEIPDILSEEAGSLPRGDAGSGTMTYGPGTQFDKVDMDNSRKTEGILTEDNLDDPAGEPLPGIEPPMGQVVGPPRRTDDINLAVANERSETQKNPNEQVDYSIVAKVDDDTEMGYGDELGLVDRFEESTEIGSGKELEPERNREPRERSEVDLDYFADEAQPRGGEAEQEDIDAGSSPVDFSFIKSLFSGGFDTDSSTNSDTDYFADEVNPLGGEADPNEDVARFKEGGVAEANFDGKDEDEGDPPPLATPKEVADDIPALLSEGEYVLPANVVRYIGLERIMDMHRQILSEIKQMEDLGMIQNVDKNGEPEEDDKEMKFLEPEEPEEGEEAVSKGTLIIASSKPKGMMCPEPLKFNGGGGADSGSGGDDAGDGPEGTAADAAAAAADGQDDGGEDAPTEAGTNDVSGQPDEIDDRDRDYFGGPIGDLGPVEADIGIDMPAQAAQNIVGVENPLDFSKEYEGLRETLSPGQFNQAKDFGLMSSIAAMQALSRAEDKDKAIDAVVDARLSHDPSMSQLDLNNALDRGFRMENPTMAGLMSGISMVGGFMPGPVGAVFSAGNLANKMSGSGNTLAGLSGIPTADPSKSAGLQANLDSIMDQAAKDESDIQGSRDMDIAGGGEVDFMDFENLDGKIKGKDIKVDKVIEDLKEKNVYIPGVGYFPLPSLMSPKDE